MRLLFSFLIFCLQIGTSSFAQKPSITILDSGLNTSLRGLSVVNQNVIWCSGSNGQVGRSIDGGKQFKWQKVLGYEQRDFRDIEAFDDKTAIIMAISEPAIILKTIDGGSTWQKVLEDQTKGMFLDAMSFDKKGNGLVIGDPIDGKIYLAKTKDFGNTWEKETQAFTAKNGEAFFASSGTNIVCRKHKKRPYLFVSGGKISRLFYSNQSIVLPLMQGKESTGANSIAIWKNKAVVVGGDFTKDQRADSNCVLLRMGCKKININTPQQQPNGYKSCVIFINKKNILACGTSGVDISYNRGINWECISKQSFHVVQKSKTGNAIYLAGAKGKVAKIDLN
jgi:hypothetical protein